MRVARIRNTTLWLTGYALAFGVSVALAGYIGFSKSMRVRTAPAPGALVASLVPLPPPVHDPHKPTVAVLLGDTRLEIRAPLRIEGDSWPIRVVLAPLFIGCATAFLFWLKRRVQKQGLRGLELKLPPVAVAVIAAALMWCAASVTPDFGFLFPLGSVFPVGLALIGALTCLAGVVSFRRARTTVNPMKPDSTSALVVSGIYRYTRNPMYLGFLLILFAWAAVLSNVLALVWLPVFVLFMNRFQISPEERVLGSRFAQDYTEYRARVRRWL